MGSGQIGSRQLGIADDSALKIWAHQYFDFAAQNQIDVDRADEWPPQIWARFVNIYTFSLILYYSDFYKTLRVCKFDMFGQAENVSIDNAMHANSAKRTLSITLSMVVYHTTYVCRNQLDLEIKWYDDYQFIITHFKLPRKSKYLIINCSETNLTDSTVEELPR